MPAHLVALWFALPFVLTLSCLAIARIEIHPYAQWASPAGQRLLSARRLQQATCHRRRERCVHCNACVGLIGTQPVDCYHPKIRAEKDAMLAAMEK